MSMMELGGVKSSAAHRFEAVVATAMVWQTASGGFAIEADDIRLAPAHRNECRSLDEVTRVLAAAGITQANIVLRGHASR